MKIAVNAVNLGSAGGLTVALNFIQSVVQSHPEVDLHLFAPRGKGYERFVGKQVSADLLVQRSIATAHRLWIDYAWIPNRLRQLRPDAVFTMGNFAVPTAVPQGLLFMWPYAIYPDESEVWNRMSHRDRIARKLRMRAFKSRLRYADIVFPQTLTAEARLSRYYGEYLRKTTVIPMAYSRVGDCDQEGRLLPKLEDDAICLLCLSRYYPHKNFEVLLEVATAVRDRGLPYRLITTIDPSQHRNAATFLSNVKSLSLERYLINIGPVPIERVDRLYGEVDGLLLPTLLESFSATYADCLHKGIPIFTSDRDFARDACGDCAFYFDPLNARSIVSTIESGFGNPQALYEVVQRGRRRIQRLPGWDRVCQQYIDSLKSIV